MSAEYQFIEAGSKMKTYKLLSAADKVSDALHCGHEPFKLSGHNVWVCAPSGLHIHHRNEVTTDSHSASIDLADKTNVFLTHSSGGACKRVRNL